MKERIEVGGVFTFEHFDKDGVLLDTWESENLVTNEGLNDLLDTYLNGDGTAKKTAFYVGLFSGAHTPAPGDTAAVPGFTEFTAYTPATRPLWVDGAAASQQITNSASKAVFTLTGPGTITGAFLKNTNTKGDTAGVLIASSRFSSSRVVVATDVLNITYTFQAASA